MRGEIQWSALYRPAWDRSPEAYVAAGVVGWGRSRRLGKYVDGRLGLKAYLGVQHYDPGRWNVAGEPRTVFFLSLFRDGRTLALRTFGTMGEALNALEAFRRWVEHEA